MNVKEDMKYINKNKALKGHGFMQTWICFMQLVK